MPVFLSVPSEGTSVVTISVPCVTLGECRIDTLPTLSLYYLYSIGARLGGDALHHSPKVATVGVVCRG